MVTLSESFFQVSFFGLRYILSIDCIIGILSIRSDEMEVFLPRRRKYKDFYFMCFNSSLCGCHFVHVAYPPLGHLLFS